MGESDTQGLADAPARRSILQVAWDATSSLLTTRKGRVVLATSGSAAAALFLNACAPQATTTERTHATPPATKETPVATPDTSQKTNINTQVQQISNGTAKNLPTWNAFTKDTIRIRSANLNSSAWPEQEPGQIITRENGVNIIPGGFVGAFVSKDGTLYNVIQVQGPDSRSANPKNFLDNSQYLLLKVEPVTIQTTDGTVNWHNQYLLDHLGGVDMSGSNGGNIQQALDGLNVLGGDNQDSSNANAVATAENAHLTGAWVGFGVKQGSIDSGIVPYLEGKKEKPTDVLSASQLTQAVEGLTSGALNNTTAPVAGSITNNLSYSLLNNAS